MYSVSFRALQAGFIATIVVAGMTSASAQIAPLQTPAQKHLQEQSYKRSDAHLNDPFKYPLKVGAFRNPDTLGAFVDPDQWKALPRSQRVSLLRDVACWCAGGQMIRKYWYEFGAIDPASGQAIEMFSGKVLWPKSGHYK
jgi:hypothetical protein